ncbi:ribosomal protein S18-alanine N-acetyltransferase [Oceanobacillus manasiensis]|uniref:ribosomal protein S18-alanine N-acetyltransferase n=1 Tax=Oceanobacillus manasiensis TaxID=586413 RepID=UPI0005A93F51|nr:ribosomal protein S18-alanine N-acetyltransferase [Oceanobacillus manasiensis]
MSEFTIRKMEIADVDQVMEVEKASFTTPWTTDIFYQEIVDNQYAYYYVIEWNGKIAGYVGTWVVLEDAQVTNIAILPGLRGQKLGEKLFHYMLLQVKLIGATRLSLEVRKSNIPAQKLYRKFGLVPGGIRKNYYTDNQEDAIVMWVNIL